MAELPEGAAHHRRDLLGLESSIHSAYTYDVESQLVLQNR